MYLALVQPFITKNPEIVEPNAMFDDIFRQIKVLLSPITPPNYDLESAAALYMTAIGVRVPRGAIKHRNPDSPMSSKGSARGRKPSSKAAEQGSDAPAKKKRRRRRKKPGTVLSNTASTPVSDKASAPAIAE